MSRFDRRSMILAILIAASAALLPMMAEAQSDPPDPRQFLDSHGGAITADQARQFLRARFEAIDSNHDGVISESEFEQHFMEEFQEADTDHDGRLTRAEIRTQLLKWRQAHPASPQP